MSYISVQQKIQIGGFNPGPFEKYEPKWVHLPLNRDGNKTYLKPPPRNIRYTLFFPVIFGEILGSTPKC